MYSYDERRQAVDLYLKLGKRIRATIRQLGYPTKNALKNWHQEFQQRGDLHVAYARSKQKYSVEQKNGAIDHYMNHGRCFSATLKALGYPSRWTLTEWVRERYPKTRKSIVGKAGRPTASLASKRAAVYELCTRDGSALGRLPLPRRTSSIAISMIRLQTSSGSPISRSSRSQPAKSISRQ